MPMDTIMSLVRNSAFRSFASSVLYWVNVEGALQMQLRIPPRSAARYSDSRSI